MGSDEAEFDLQLDSPDGNLQLVIEHGGGRFIVQSLTSRADNAVGVAAAAGVRVGDRIVSVHGQRVDGLKNIGELVTCVYDCCGGKRNVAFKVLLRVARFTSIQRRAQDRVFQLLHSPVLLREQAAAAAQAESAEMPSLSSTDDDESASGFPTLR